MDETMRDELGRLELTLPQVGAGLGGGIQPNLDPPASLARGSMASGASWSATTRSSTGWMARSCSSRPTIRMAGRLSPSPTITIASMASPSSAGVDDWFESFWAQPRSFRDQRRQSRSNGLAHYEVLSTDDYGTAEWYVRSIERMATLANAERQVFM